MVQQLGQGQSTMSHFKISVVRRDGVSHESTFGGWFAETAMIAQLEAVKADKKTLFVATFEGIERDGIDGIAWAVRGTFTAANEPKAPPRSFALDDFVAIVAKDHVAYGHNGQIHRIESECVDIKLTTGPNRGTMVSAVFAEISLE
jgi:hypothetical protein